MGARFPGPAGRGTTTFTLADVAIGGHRVVKATETGCDYASNQTLSDIGKIIGVTDSAVSAGARATVVTAGEIIEPTWAWTMGAVYLSTNGTLTQTVPTTGFVQQIGTAVSSTKIVIQIQSPIEVI